MTSNNKFDVHPDAESLNAFTEQALTEGERGQILAHLAECSRCREVVYLAREAALKMEPEIELAVAAAAPQSVPRKERWSRSWLYAWAPAGALAVVISVAYIVHVRHVEIAAEQASVAREAAAHKTAMASTSYAPPMEMKAAAPAATAAPAVSAPKRPKPEEPNRVSDQLTPVAGPPPLGEASAMAGASSNEGASQPGASGARSPAIDAEVEYKPEPALADRRLEQERAAGAFQARSLGVQKRSGTKAGASAGEPEKRDQTEGMLAAAAPMAQLEASAAKSGSAKASGRHKEGGVFALYKVKPAALPSGLTAVSTAMTSSATVAVDGAGSVFRSEDAGVHWESVAKQWSGHAVTVQLQATENANAGVARSPTAVFEILNDQGQVWTSTDGRIWKAR